MLVTLDLMMTDDDDLGGVSSIIRRVPSGRRVLQNSALTVKMTGGCSVTAIQVLHT